MPHSHMLRALSMKHACSHSGQLKFKFDLNLPLQLAEDLRALGHDAETVVSEGLDGSEDPLIIEAACGSHPFDSKWSFEGG